MSTGVNPVLPTCDALNIRNELRRVGSQLRPVAWMSNIRESN